MHWSSKATSWDFHSAFAAWPQINTKWSMQLNPSVSFCTNFAKERTVYIFLFSYASGRWASGLASLFMFRLYCMQLCLSVVFVKNFWFLYFPMTFADALFSFSGRFSVRAGWQLVSRVSRVASSGLVVSRAEQGSHFSQGERLHLLPISSMSHTGQKGSTPIWQKYNMYTICLYKNI